MSFQTSGLLVEPRPLFQASVNAAEEAGVIMVAAAGNVQPRGSYDQPEVATLPIPARYSGVLAIGASQDGATLQDELRWVDSLYDTLDPKLLVVAPVEKTSSLKVVSTLPNNQYTSTFTATSAASPIAAGVVALMLTLNRELTYQQISKILAATAEKIGNYSYGSDGRTNEVGYGRINAYQALLLTHAYSNKSVSSTATAYNNGRRMVRDEGNDRYHLVFESGGEIFYRRSNVGGTSWEDPLRLTTGNGNNKYPSVVFNSGKLYVVWQRNTGGNNYTIYFRRNPGSGWGSTVSLGTVSFSSPNNPLPVLTVKEVRVTGGTRKIRLLACWKSSSSITYRYSDNDGGSWAAAASLPSTTSSHQSPSLSPGAFFDYSFLDIYVTYDNPTYAVYLNKYHTDLTSNTTTWGSPEVVPASSATGPRFSQVTSGDYPEPSPNLYAVWQGFDPVEQMEAVYYQGKVSGAWTASTAYVNSSYQRPTITNLSSGNLAMLWDNGSNVYKATYSGSPKSWSSSQLVGPGFNVNPSISFGMANPSSAARYIWTSGAATPYQIQVSTEILQKPAVLESQYHRRITVADTMGAVFLIDLGEIYVETIGGLASSLEFVGVNDTLISLTDENLWTDLQTKPIVLPLDVDTLVVEKAVYSQNPERLAEQRSSGITVTFELADATTGNALARIGNQIVIQQSGRVALTSKTAISSWAGKKVFLRPVVHGLSKGRPDLLFSLMHVHYDADMRKVAERRDSWPSTTPSAREYRLWENYPNPFNAETMIRYSLAEGGKVTLRIFNLLGQVIRTVVDEEKTAGHHQAVWDGRNDGGDVLGSGMYFYRIEAGDFVETKKLVLVK